MYASIMIAASGKAQHGKRRRDKGEIMARRKTPDQDNYREIEVPDTGRRAPSRARGTSAGSRMSSGRRGQSSGWEDDDSRRAQGRGRRDDSRRMQGRGSGSGRGRTPGRGYAPQRPRPVVTPSNLLLALIGFLFLACVSVVLVLNLRTIYYFDIRYQQLESRTGLPEETIRENYDTLIDYNLVMKGVKKLEFPDFPMSEQGETHFREVKRIFFAIQYLLVISGVGFLFGISRKLRRRDYGSLKLVSILTFVVPLALGVLAVASWDSFFIKFHEIFFRNDYWIFDPVTDPVIRILPDAFFFHCAVAILFFLLLGGVLTGAIYRFATRKYRRQRQMEQLMR